MSSSIKPRIRRGPPPDKRLTRRNYRKAAIEALRRDFQDRCAYSCQHLNRAGGLRCMEIDHFDPRLKDKFIQRYDNLFLATRHCNGAKGDTWPTRAEQALGLRFLNSCAEQDYGKHIFEDPETHRLVGVTHAGRYHIRMLDLNADHLVAERGERAKIRTLLTRLAFMLKRGRSEAKAVELIAALRRQVEEMMPTFADLPKDRTG